MAVIKSGASSDQLTVDATSKAARVTVYNADGTVGGEQETYRASTIIPLVAAVTVDRPFFNIIGSDTKTVKITKIAVSGVTLTAVGYFTIAVQRLSTVSTGGTSTTLATVKLDTDNADATAVVKAYTVAPTRGTLVGTISSWRALWQATLTVGTSITVEHEFKYGDTDHAQGLTLRGATQEIALVFPVVLATAGTLSVDIEWTEE
jgi:hypothetical protein